MEHAMLADTTMYLPDDLLTKVDRASMAVGLEVRVPMLDPELFKFAWSPWTQLGSVSRKLPRDRTFGWRGTSKIFELTDWESHPPM